MSADPKSNPYENTLLSLAAFRRGLPGLQRSINTQILPSELAQANAARTVTPIYTDIINQANNSAGINNSALETFLLDTFGRNRAGIASEIDQQINPQFYFARQAGLDNLLKAIEGINLDSTTEAERAVNAENVRSGNINNPGGVTSVSNAMQFGDEKLKRISALDQVLNTTNQFLTNSRATFDPFGRSTVEGQTTVNAPQPSQFADIARDVGESSNNLLNNVFSTGNNAMNNNANRRSSAEVTLSSLPDY